MSRSIWSLLYCFTRSYFAISFNAVKPDRYIQSSGVSRIMSSLTQLDDQSEDVQSMERSRNQTCGLALEIWIIILDMVIEMDLACYDSSPSISSPLFLRGWDFLTIESNTRWRNLRLVCRSWSFIVNPYQTPFLKVDHVSQLSDGVRTRGLYISNGSMWGYYHTLESYPLGKDLLLATAGITTIVVGTEEPQIKTNRTAIEFLLNHPQYFPNVHSLSLFIDRDPSSFSWRDIERAFPLLTELRVRRYGIHEWGVPTLVVQKRDEETNYMNISLLHLEKVEISVGRLPTCNFPALKHAAVSSSLRDNMALVLGNSTHNLESLIIWNHNVLSRGLLRSFWKFFPNLRFLGMPEVTLYKLRSPPNHHPLQYIWLLDYSAYDMRNTPDLRMDIRKLRIRFPQLRHLTVDVDDLRPSVKSYFQESCMSRGLDYVDVVNRKHLQQKPKSKSKQKRKGCPPSPISSSPSSQGYQG